MIIISYIKNINTNKHKYKTTSSHSLQQYAGSSTPSIHDNGIDISHLSAAEYTSIRQGKGLSKPGTYFKLFIPGPEDSNTRDAFNSMIDNPSITRDEFNSMIEKQSIYFIKDDPKIYKDIAIPAGGVTEEIMKIILDEVNESNNTGTINIGQTIIVLVNKHISQRFGTGLRAVHIQ